MVRQVASKRIATMDAPMSRRTFVVGSVALVGAFSTVACAFGDDHALGGGSLAVARFDPKGGGDYPTVRSDYPSLLRPLDLEWEEFEPLTVEEEGGTRVVTPFYSIFIPSGLFDGEWSFRYEGGMHSWSPDGIGQMTGNRLVLSYTVPGNQEFLSSIDVRTISTDWNAIQGEMVGATVGPVVSDHSIRVFASIPADFSGRTWLQERERLASYTCLVNPYIVAVPDGSGTWSVVEIQRPEADIKVVDGVAMIRTPCYSANVPISGLGTEPRYDFWDLDVVLDWADGRPVATCWVLLYGEDSSIPSYLVCALRSDVGDLSRISDRIVWEAVGDAGDDGSIVCVGYPTVES